MNMTWSRILMGGGPFSYLLVVASLVGVILGVISIRNCHYSRNKNLPYYAKLLPFFAILSFLCGVLGYSVGRIKAFSVISALGANVLVADMAQIEIETNGALTFGAIVAGLYILAYIVSVRRFELSKSHQNITTG